MEKKKLLAIVALSGLISGMSAQNADARDGYEEGRGVSPSGANSCAGHSHTCGGYAQRDWDPQEMVYVQNGGCEHVRNVMRDPVMRRYVKEVAINAFKYWRRAPIPE